MSDYTRTTQMLIEGRWPAAQLKLAYQEGRCLAWVYQTSQVDGGDEILALAAGRHHGEACSMLNHLIVRPQGTALTTQEAAAVLGVTDGRVRQFEQAGRLVPAEPGAMGGTAARFLPAAVHRFLQLPRRPARRELSEREIEDGSPAQG